MAGGVNNDNYNNNYNGYSHDYSSFGYNQNFDNQNDYQNLPGYGEQVFQYVQSGMGYAQEQFQNVIPCNPLNHVIPFNPLEHIEVAGMEAKEKIKNIFSEFVAAAKHRISSVIASRTFKIAAVVIGVGLVVTGIALAKTVLTVGCIVLAILLAKRLVGR